MNTRRRLLRWLAVAWAWRCWLAAQARRLRRIAAVQTLAPTGKLRVGLYPGTTTSIIGDPWRPAMRRGSDSISGGNWRSAPAFRSSRVVFANNAEVFAAAKAGSVDMVFTNATPVRRIDLDFSPTVLQVEQGYLVPARSAIRTLDEIDRAGVRVGVSEGSTSEATLSRELHNAVVVRTPSLKAAIDMLAAGKLEAFATNKATLFEMSADLPASRVSMAAGDWRVSPSAFRRAARRRCRLSAASSARPSPAAPWREPSSERDYGAP